MKFQLDAGVSRSTRDYLRTQGHESVHVQELNGMQWSDSRICDRARLDGSGVITWDLDFGVLMVKGGRLEPSVLILQTPEWINARLRDVIGECLKPIAAGAVVVVEDARFRVRRLASELTRSVLE